MQLQVACNIVAACKMHLDILKINVYYLSIRESQVGRGVGEYEQMFPNGQ